MAGHASVCQRNSDNASIWARDRARKIERARLLREARQRDEPDPEEYASSRLSRQLIARQPRYEKSAPVKPVARAGFGGDVSFYEDALDLYVRGEWADDLDAESRQALSGHRLQQGESGYENRIEELEHQVMLVRAQLQMEKQDKERLGKELEQVKNQVLNLSSPPKRLKGCSSSYQRDQATKSRLRSGKSGLTASRAVR